MNKKAISTLISYVLLIGLAVAMSGIIYAWLNFYVKQPFAEESCHEVSLVITDYNCSEGILSLTVQNRGRFSLDGYTLKINNGTGDYNLYQIGSLYNYIQAPMDPGNITTGKFNFSRYGTIKTIETEAIRRFTSEGKPVLCENSITRQNIENCQ